MKRIIIATVGFILSLSSFAQDMIVKKDGSIIQAKVVKVGTTEVDYKKWSNQDGPSYAIEKSDIFAITYQNGEKEMFEAINYNGTSDNSSNEPSEKAKAANSRAIEEWNSTSLVYSGKEGEKAKYTIWSWGIDRESEICNDDIEISFKNCYQFHLCPKGLDILEWTEQNNETYESSLPGVGICVENKSDKILYFDLGASSFSRNGESSVLFDNTVTTKGTGSTSGGSVGIGIMPGLSLGLGGGSSDMTTTIKREERIVAVSPHSKMVICHQPIFLIDKKKFSTHQYRATKDPIFKFITMNHGNPSHWTCVYPYFNIENYKDVKTGVSFKYTQENSPMKFSLYLTYSNNQDFSTSKNICTKTYVKEVMGVHSDSMFPESYLQNYRFGILIRVSHNKAEQMYRLGE